MSPAETSLISLITLVLWTGCVAVGVTGFIIPYPRPMPRANEPPPVQAISIDVDTAHDVSPPPRIAEAASPDASTPQPAAPPAALDVPPEPPMATVGVPDKTIAFALPTEGPARTVDTKQAVPIAHASATQPITPPQAVRHLTYGRGEGSQPAPEYPREAAIARQKGTVVVQFTVGEDGRVLSAHASSPCPFPLLNQAALRAVREAWRFRAGPIRTYEVSIEFDLKERQP